MTSLDVYAGIGSLTKKFNSQWSQRQLQVKRCLGC